MTKQLEKLSLRKNRGKVSPISSSSDAESTCTCTVCGMEYGEQPSLLWIQCDLCGNWLDEQCTKVDLTNIPDNFVCPDCAML